jgi:mannose-1-phosphate guanylyltransferase
MKVVLLAAGLGTRLRPITDTVPKCLVPIYGESLLDLWIAKFVQRDDVSEIYINLHHLPEKVTRHLDTNWQHEPKIKTWFELELLGTGGTIRAHAAELADDTVVIVHADNLSVFDVDEFVQTFEERPIDVHMTMMLFHTDTPQSCGIIERDHRGIVLHMHEKVVNPPGNLANGAVYIIDPVVIETIVAKQYTDFSNQVIPHYLGKINTWVNDLYHRDIGTPESYQKALKDIREIPLMSKSRIALKK